MRPLCALLVPLLLLVLVHACAAVVLDGSACEFVGRVDKRDPLAVRFDWSGVEIWARFRGTSVRVRFNERKSDDGMAPPPTWSPFFKNSQFDVEVDGQPAPLLSVTGDGTTREYVLATKLIDGEHVVKLAKRTEAMFGITTFYGFVVDQASAIKTSPRPVPAYRFLFFGDSVTNGFGVLGTTATCPFTADTQDVFAAWAGSLTSTLHAESHYICKSGIGILRNAGEEKPSLTPMSTFFNRRLMHEDTPVNPAEFVPDGIFIYLGNNDFSTTKANSSVPDNAFVAGYVQLVTMLANTYLPLNKNLKIYEPIVTFDTGVTGANMMAAAMAISKSPTLGPLFAYAAPSIPQDIPVSFNTDFGCSVHPNAALQGRVAQWIVKKWLFSVAPIPKVPDPKPQPRPSPSAALPRAMVSWAAALLALLFALDLIARVAC